MTTALQETTTSIHDIADSIGISEAQLIPYGKYKAKISLPVCDNTEIQK
ncbi:MAG: formate--tetrahydrofolate ligase [Sphingobacteriales bacterium]|nr:formate--tetrahydrofolate ligase [Sphingobacteriales bacterium]